MHLNPSSMSRSATVVSAPGKVLIAGGYLVLDPKYRGTVVSTSSRFYSVVRNAQNRRGSATQANHIQVSSPQFVGAQWHYLVHKDVCDTGEARVRVEEGATNTSSNKFVHLALRCTIALAVEIRGIEVVTTVLAEGLDVVVVGDNDFYSQRENLSALNLPRSLASLAQIPPFISTNGTLATVHKTGLGSSAALITSLVSALLLHFGIYSPSEIEVVRDLSTEADGKEERKRNSRRLVHNVAQYVHCLAQGKVGSGFDVAAAVFGSMLYTRFSPEVLSEHMEEQPEDAVYHRRLLPVLANEAWDHRVEPFALPPLTQLMLADVDAGSDTPSFVGMVLKWRSENPKEVLELWTTLDELNQRFAQTLLDLSKLHEKHPQHYATSINYIASLQPVQWGVSTSRLLAEEQHIISIFYDAHQISQAVRKKMREMGRLSGVLIEPPEQTELLDACVSLSGVVGGGVPGAGGFDAVWLLVCNPVDSVQDVLPSARVERIWSTYTPLDVSPLSAVESKAGGLRVEDLEAVPRLKEVVLAV